MKKCTLFCLLTIISFTQIKGQGVGNTLFGGNFSFISNGIESRSQDKNELQLSISPVIGTMVSEKVAIGMAFGYSYSKYNEKRPYVYSSESKALVVATYVRIHNNITENFKYFIEPNLGKTFMLGDKSDNKTQIYNFGINVGLLYFISQKMSMEFNIAGINYIHMADKDYNMISNNVSIDYDLVTPNIGLKYYF